MSPQGPPPLSVDPLRTCTTYARPGAAYPIAIDRLGLVNANGYVNGNGNVAVNNRPTTVVSQPMYRPTGTYNQGMYQGQNQGMYQGQYQGQYPVQGATYQNRPPQVAYNPRPMAQTFNQETLPSITEVQGSVQNAQLTETTSRETIQMSAENAGKSISDSFERAKMNSANALQQHNPTSAADVTGRIQATIDNGRNAVNTALANVQNNPTGSMADARAAAFITLAEVERTLRENGVPEDQAKLIVEQARAEVNSAIDNGVAAQTNAMAANAAAKAQVKTTTEQKIEEITTAANQQITNHLSNLNGQVKTAVTDPAKQREIEDMLNRARNDIAANMASAKSNPTSAAQVSRTTAHATLNEIARIMREQGVPQEAITSMIEPTRTNVLDVINEAEYKIGTSIYEASKVDVRM